MLVVFLLTGEAFLSDVGKDYGVRYLSLVVYTGLVITCAFYMAYQTNTFTYYSLMLIIGNLMLFLSITALLQTENALASAIGEVWVGFFGECFNSPRTIIILLTMVLASVMPSWSFLTIWAELRPPESKLVIEKETIAAREDEPLFFDPPKNE
jgi:hypothetical protein